MSESNPSTAPSMPVAAASDGLASPSLLPLEPRLPGGSLHTAFAPLARDDERYRQLQRRAPAALQQWLLDGMPLSHSPRGSSGLVDRTFSEWADDFDRAVSPYLTPEGRAKVVAAWRAFRGAEPIAQPALFCGDLAKAILADFAYRTDPPDVPDLEVVAQRLAELARWLRNVWYPTLVGKPARGLRVRTRSQLRLLIAETTATLTLSAGLLRGNGLDWEEIESLLGRTNRRMEEAPQALGLSGQFAKWSSDVIHIIDGLRYTPSTPASATSHTLDPRDRAILEQLANVGTTMTQEGIADKVGLADKTVGARLRRLREIGYTNRPLGGRKGEAISQQGLSAIGRCGGTSS